MLPPEILLHIFSFLESEPFELISCCTAHYVFAQIIEPALYCNVVVHNMPPAKSAGATFKTEEDGFRLSAPELSNILSNSPHVVRYLHGLTIELSHFHLDSEATKRISSILHKLRPLRITLSGTDSFLLDWSYFPVHFARAFVGSVSKSHLREVSIASVLSVPLSMFRNCTGLKTLKLHNGSTSSIELQQASPIPAYPLLEHLEITRWTYGQPSVLISWLKPRIINLRSLMLKTSNERIWHILPKLLSICSKTLVELDIDFHSGMFLDHLSLIHAYLKTIQESQAKTLIFLVLRVLSDSSYTRTRGPLDRKASMTATLSELHFSPSYQLWRQFLHLTF